MRTLLRAHLALGALLALLPISLRAERLAGPVTRVPDGDTITVLARRGRTRKPVKVRLYGIDCPEASQAFGKRAKQFTTALTRGRNAVVDVRGTDSHGLIVGVVWVGRRSVGEELVRAGLAWWQRESSPNERTLARLERQARAAHRGLWADKTPVPPWAFGRTGRRPGTPAGGVARRRPSAEDTRAWKTCRANLQTIANAVQAARVRSRAADYSLLFGPATTANMPDLLTVPVCPLGGRYTIEPSVQPGGFRVRCSRPEHGAFEPGKDLR